jgi:HD-like signal output (HDOD) protein
MQQPGSLLGHITKLLDSGYLKLPVYNPILLKLQEAVSNEDVGEVERLIMTDQAMAAEVIQAANSPFFCGISPVRTIRTAIVRVGMWQIRRLVILSSERAKYRAESPALQSMLRDLWRHASTTALASQWLSKRLRLTGIEEICFLGGLLHDIGKLVILKYLDDRDEIEKTPVPTLLKEIPVSAHCELGHRVLSDWNIPEIYCQIARDHHMGNAWSGDIPLTIVRLANRSSQKLCLGLDSIPSPDLASTPEAHLLNVEKTLLEELQKMLQAHLAKAA